MEGEKELKPRETFWLGQNRGWKCWFLSQMGSGVGQVWDACRRGRSSDLDLQSLKYLLDIGTEYQSLGLSTQRWRGALDRLKKKINSSENNKPITREHVFVVGGTLTPSVSAESREAVCFRISLLSGIMEFSWVPASVPTFSLLSASHTGKVRCALLRQCEWKRQTLSLRRSEIGWSHSPRSSTFPTRTQGMQNPQGPTDHTLRTTIKRFSALIFMLFSACPGLLSTPSPQIVSSIPQADISVWPCLPRDLLKSFPYMYKFRFTLCSSKDTYMLVPSYSRNTS